MKKILLLLVAIQFVLFANYTLAQALTTVMPEYVSPHPGAQLVSAGTTIALRQGETIKAQSFSSSLFTVVGTKSGIHSGAVVLADDNQTVIFKPAQPFAPGERVAVTVARGIQSASGNVLGNLAFAFTISPRTAAFVPPPANELDLPTTPHLPQAPQANLPHSFTLPSDLPFITVTTPATQTGDGYIFTAPIPDFPTPSMYLLVLDNSGQLVYYRQTNGLATDFKKQQTGVLTFWEYYQFVALDNSYNIVNTYQAGDGYTTDIHDLQLLPNGHALMVAYDYEPYDMSQIVAGGYPTATVVGLIIQELDTFNNVVFEWRSWDHFNITDTYENLIAPTVDYVHGNAVELDTDGNLLISSRHMAEITKINRATGDIMWRLGGKNNQFTFTNEISPSFYYQHDIRRQANGDLTLFNNRTGLLPAYSEVKEYQIDEPSRTITRVWSFTNTPEVYSYAMGDAQSLPNGNTLVGWGTAPYLTEVHADGTKAFELAFSTLFGSYRSFRFPWHGYPNTLPTLVANVNPPTTTLAFSWNGATDISAYRVYGGNAPHPTNLLTTTAKTGFETQVNLLDTSDCYFRVMPLDTNGWATTYSNDAFTCWSSIPTFLPLIFQDGNP